MRKIKPIFWIIGILLVVAIGIMLFWQLNPVMAPSGTVTGNDNPDIIAGSLIEGALVAPTPVESNPDIVSSDSDITSGFDQAADTTNF
jgi:hypothetical protein